MDTPAAISRMQSSRCPVAWEFLYRKYRNEVRKFAGWFLRNDDAAEELTQELFLRLPHRIKTYNPATGDFEPWLITMVANYARNWKKAQAALPEILPLVSENLKGWNPDTEQHRIREHEAAAFTLLHDSIDALSADDQQAIHRYLVGYSSREVAAKTNEPPRQAQKRLHKAVKHLRQETLR